MSGFSDWNSGPDGIKSTWRNKRNSTETSMQTDQVNYCETGSQVVTSNVVETQTEITGPSNNYEEMKPPYPPSLFAFFAKVTNPMCEALEENLNPLYNLSIAMSMNDRENMNDDDAEDNSTERNVNENAIKLYELRSPNPSNDYLASSVAWNCNGTQVVVGYSMKEHKQWCSHSAQVSLWSLGRLQNDMISSKKSIKSQNIDTAGPPPHKEIVLPSCITSLEFHPNNSSVLAVGLYSGEIVLIDFFASSTSTNIEVEKDKAAGGKLESKSSSNYRDDSSYGTINSDGIFCLINTPINASAIETIKWVTITSSSQLGQLVHKNPNPSQYMILTTAKDGIIGLWSVNKIYNRIYLEKRFVILPRNLPETIDNKVQLSISMKEMGITALASCKLEPSTFIVGTFGCFMFQGDLTSGDEIDPNLELDMIQSSRETSPISNGQAIFLTQMKSYIKSIDFSPYHQNLFLVCTTHGHVELQHTLKPGIPTHKFYLMEDEGVDVKWTGRPMLFGAAWANTLALYDLMKNAVEPSLNIEHKDLLCAIAFNKTETDLVATIDIKGYLHIWKLPASLKGTTEFQQEMDALIKLGSAGK